MLAGFRCVLTCWDFPEDFGGHEILEPLRVVAGSVNRYTVLLAKKLGEKRMIKGPQNVHSFISSTEHQKTISFTNGCQNIIHFF